MSDPVLAFDRSTRFKDEDGRLHVPCCNIAKATVSPYLGREIPGYKRLGLHPNAIYQLYRDPDELRKAANTFDNSPLLIKHVPVSADVPENELIVGTIGSNVRYEHPYLKASLAAWTQEGIDLIESGQQEQLSPGYRFDADMTPGNSPEGLPYHGVMRNIRGNHVAIVENGRQGPDVVVADEVPPELSTMRFKNLIPALVALMAATPTVEQQMALDAALDKDLQPPEPVEPPAPVSITLKIDASDVVLALDSAMAEVGAGLQAQIDAAVAKARAEGKAEGAAQAQQMALDAATATQTAATELASARDAVKEVCGDVACDSAAAVYEFAFKHLGVDFDGIPAAGYPKLYRAASKTAAPVPVKVAAPVAVTAVFPNLSNIHQG